MIVVTDNGPLGHLIQIARAELLPRLYERVLLPPAVLWELSHKATPHEVRAWIEARPEWIELVVPKGEPDHRRPGAGEREAIRLAKELDAILLCDDLRAMKRGRTEGLLVTGTLGVLQQAHAYGWVTIEEEIVRLRERTTMRLPEDRLPAIVREAHRLRAELTPVSEA